jgi:hypothetical protein
LNASFSLIFLSSAPFTHASSHPVGAGIKGIKASTTLPLRSTWNQRGVDPNFVTVPLQHRFLQLVAFVFCPCTRTSIHLRDAGRDIMQFYYDLQAARIAIQSSWHHHFTGMLLAC